MLEAAARSPPAPLPLSEASPAKPFNAPPPEALRCGHPTRTVLFSYAVFEGPEARHSKWQSFFFVFGGSKGAKLVLSPFLQGLALGRIREAVFLIFRCSRTRLDLLGRARAGEAGPSTSEKFRAHPDKDEK